MLHIYPEGATTTGNGGLLRFKKGAFASLRPVQPLCFKYWSLRTRVSDGDAVTQYFKMCMVMQAIVSTVTIFKLPIFEPNDYFLKNHV